jgi:hypothetical protein
MVRVIAHSVRHQPGVDEPRQEGVRADAMARKLTVSEIVS